LYYSRKYINILNAQEEMEKEEEENASLVAALNETTPPSTPCKEPPKNCLYWFSTE